MVRKVKKKLGYKEARACEPENPNLYCDECYKNANACDECEIWFDDGDIIYCKKGKHLCEDCFEKLREDFEDA